MYFETKARKLRGDRIYWVLLIFKHYILKMFHKI